MVWQRICCFHILNSWLARLQSSARKHLRNIAIYAAEYVGCYGNEKAGHRGITGVIYARYSSDNRREESGPFLSEVLSPLRFVVLVCKEVIR